MSRLELGCALAVGILAASPAAHAIPSAELLINGNFEQVAAGVTRSTQVTSTDRSSAARQAATSNVTGWSTTGYDFVFLANAAAASGSEADTVGTTSGVKLWGPGDGAANGLTTSLFGRNFIGASNGTGAGAISQVVNGLDVGRTYALSFAYAGAQQLGYDGASEERWSVSFGAGPSQTTNPVDLASAGFSGWREATMYFTASATTQTLSFQDIGAPSDAPTFALLDGVSLVAVPEPGTTALLLIGVTGAGAAAHRRRRRRA